MVSNVEAKRLIEVNIGLNEEARQGVVDLLSDTLADQHMLYMKLRKYHWNVTGSRFHSLHETFEEQYTEIADSIDVTAETIRRYGAFAPGTFAEFLERSSLDEHRGNVPNAHQMVANLVADHETAVRMLRERADKAGEDYEDKASEDYFVELIHEHQNYAWLLRAFLEGDDSI